MNKTSEDMDYSEDEVETHEKYYPDDKAEERFGNDPYQESQDF